MNIWARRRELEGERWLTLYHLLRPPRGVMSQIEHALATMALPYMRDAKQRDQEYIRKLMEDWCLQGPLAVTPRGRFSREPKGRTVPADRRPARK